MAIRKIREILNTSIDALFGGESPKWEEEFTRIAAEMSQFAEATYANPSKSVINYVYDMQNFMSQVPHANDNFDIESHQYKWWEFFARGYFDKEKGKFVFRTPSPRRLAMTVGALDYKSYLPQAALRSHSVDIDTGYGIIADERYGQVFNADRSHGMYRGAFISEAIVDEGVRYSLIIILHVEGEAFCRTRDFIFDVKGANAGEVMVNIGNSDVHLIDSRDGLAAFGENHGVVWNYPCPTSHRQLEDFNWMSKSHRCIKFTAKSIFGESPDQNYHLARYPAQIEIVMSLLLSAL